MRPRAETVYPFWLAHSRMALVCNGSRVDVVDAAFFALAFFVRPFNLVA